MMKFWKSFCLLAMFLAFCVSVECWGQDVKADDPDAAEEAEEQLPASPLKLLDVDYVNAGEMTELTVRDLEFTVENSGKEAVLFKRAMSSCSCLTIEEAPSPGRVEAGAKLTFKLKLDGNLIGDKLKTFERRVYIECAKFSRCTVAVRGSFKKALEIKPSNVLTLGRFEGVNIPWLRKITISVNDERMAKELELAPPAPSRNFEFKLSRNEQQDYELEIRPKLPMRPGTISEQVFLPKVDETAAKEDLKETKDQKDQKDQKGVKLLIKGEVIGARLIMPQKKLTVYRALDDVDSQTVTLQFKKTENDMMKNRRQRRSMRMMTPHMLEKEQRRWDEKTNIAKEEEEQKEEYNRKYWEMFDKNLGIRCPEGITASREISSEGMKVILKITAAAWGDGEVIRHVDYQWKGKKISGTELHLNQPKKVTKEVPAAPAP